MAAVSWARALPKPAIPTRLLRGVLGTVNRNATGNAHRPSRIGTVSVIGRVGVVSKLPVTASTRYYARSNANRIKVKVQCPVPPAQAGTVSIVGYQMRGYSTPVRPTPALKVGTTDESGDSLSQMMMVSEYPYGFGPTNTSLAASRRQMHTDVSADPARAIDEPMLFSDYPFSVGRLPSS